MRIIVGMSGASGACLGVRFLRECQRMAIETHLVVSKWAERTLELETEVSMQDLCGLATTFHDGDDLGAPIASGSFRHDGMVVIPCSMKTAGAIANGYSATLLERAADVTIKEGRRLILVARETPLSAIHLENLLKLARIGVTIMPPVPAFYNQPENMNDIVGHFVGRVLDRLGVDNDLVKRWQGLD